MPKRAFNSKDQRNRDLQQQLLTADAAVEACPKCGALPGELCTRSYRNVRITAGAPHPERIEFVNKVRKAL